MWIRLKLDIGWRDLAYAFARSLVPGGRGAAQQRLEDFWSAGQGDALACLSVRSGFDLLLQALELPEGSEVLFSAITLRDMPAIAESHRLVPVPVDLAGSDFHIDVNSLQRAITPKSRVLVVAHLFGARPDMREVFEIAREHNLFVVEDCAQAWCGPGWRGNPAADASLFSFGAIKTGTALGGALCRIGEPETRNRMRAIQNQQPVQLSRGLPLKVLKFAGLKLVSHRRVFGAIAWLGRRFGRSVDDILGGLTRGFSGENLLSQLRRQPAAGILRLLDRRMRTYDTRRIERRTRNARRIVANLELESAQPELRDPQHSFWLFPLLSDRAADLIAELRRHGFDTTQRGRMEVVPPPPERPRLAASVASNLLERTVFLPCYPELSPRAIDRMCALISPAAR